MKIRVSLLTIFFLAIFSTGAVAAKLEHGHNKAIFGHFEDDKDDSAIKKSDDGLKELSEIHNQSHHIFQAMNHEEHGSHHGHENSGDHDEDDGDDDGHGNEVPLPGAVWLFGSALLGLLGIKRKSA